MNAVRLPGGYRLIEVMDFVRNRRQLQIVAFSALGTAAAMLAAGLAARPVGITWRFMLGAPWTFAVLLAAHAAYILLHELTHGAFMYALSGVRPRFGLRLPYAWAGSDACFGRAAHALIALAPVTVWGAALFLLERRLPAPWFWILYSVQISNVSGSTGDIYCVLHLLRLPRGVLVRDTGTRMLLYVPRPAAEESK